LGWDDTYIDEAGNVVASRGDGKNEIAFLGHIDTVEGGPEVQMDDDFIWGRGAVDAKGPLCAMAVAGGRAKLDPGFKLTLIAAVGRSQAQRGLFIGSLCIHLKPALLASRQILMESLSATAVALRRQSKPKTTELTEALTKAP